MLMEAAHSCKQVQAATTRFDYPKLVSVPLFDLYDNPGRYGPIMASLPALLSR